MEDQGHEVLGKTHVDGHMCMGTKYAYICVSWSCQKSGGRMTPSVMSSRICIFGNTSEGVMGLGHEQSGHGVKNED